MVDLLNGLEPPRTIERFSAAAIVLRGFCHEMAAELVAEVDRIAAVAPFRNMVTPGGFRMSVGMTNCGCAGWVTDRKGYRYVRLDPISGTPWPAMPNAFRLLATAAAETAGYLRFTPDACLINLYEPGTRLSLHRDENEHDLTAPIVSVSLGLPAVFLFGGSRRGDRTRRILLESGDVVVWGGPDRLAYHGIAPLAKDDDPLTGNRRINLTFRKAL